MEECVDFKNEMIKSRTLLDKLKETEVSVAKFPDLPKMMVPVDVALFLKRDQGKAYCTPLPRHQRYSDNVGTALSAPKLRPPKNVGLKLFDPKWHLHNEYTRVTTAVSHDIAVEWRERRLCSDTRESKSTSQTERSHQSKSCSRTMSSTSITSA
jgi:hypothetical protein